MENDEQENSVSVPPSRSLTVPQTGLIVPNDVRIRLVRADNATLEVILSILYSVAFTVAGIIGGAISSKGLDQSTAIEVFAAIAFSLFAFALATWWICLKLHQARKGIEIPLSLFDKLT